MTSWPAYLRDCYIRWSLSANSTVLQHYEFFWTCPFSSRMQSSMMRLLCTTCSAHYNRTFWVRQLIHLFLKVRSLRVSAENMQFSQCYEYFEPEYLYVHTVCILTVRIVYCTGAHNYTNCTVRSRVITRTVLVCCCHVRSSCPVSHTVNISWGRK